MVDIDKYKEGKMYQKFYPSYYCNKFYIKF